MSTQSNAASTRTSGRGAVLAGLPADAAVSWTRVRYRRHAVETPGQRRCVRWFATRS